ncbi:mannosyltransferase [Spathaspora passalidarum NRRL Y-27907]|uniref:Mannosyltransferase n=1 Tax=Spathaspora passalidarum (strain NRRL Y-27907 / 11-Y1) TaxID=619300 RepID=G3ARA8_SPAPN|nr:mannosyltransferase [Spathaspora passalidarum NRRL Y-27907]EGW31715.1 mannosyltransferase [Spathaspora passalidarum NRRL Y-27907]
MVQPGLKRFIFALLTLWIIYFTISSLFTSHTESVKEFSSAKLELVNALETHFDWKKTGLNFQPTSRIAITKDTIVQQQLSSAFPYDPNDSFPKKIWQTWKVGLDEHDFPHKYRRYQGTWEQKNAGYKHYVLSDAECDVLVEKLFVSVPDVAHTYKIMPKSILKADFFRYLILFAKGGVYTDIDTTALKPIDDWVSNSQVYLGVVNNAGLVVGIEADPDRPDWAEWYARRIQFCQWTIQSKKGHPMLGQLIAKITELTLQREEQGTLEKVLGKDEGGDIMNWTGPGIFTDYVFAYINSILESRASFKSRKYDGAVDWKLFTGMEQPIVLDDVMVLPITSFSPDVNTMGAGDSKHPIAYAKHMFSGSWKKDDPMPGMED